MTNPNAHLDAWYGRNNLLDMALLDEHDAGQHAAPVARCVACQYVATTTPEERAWNDAEFQRGWDEAKEASFQAAQA